MTSNKLFDLTSVAAVYRAVATMLLNGASMRDSYEPYEAERRALYGAAEAAS
jgi:hypothetical protein